MCWCFGFHQMATPAMSRGILWNHCPVDPVREMVAAAILAFLLSWLTLAYQLLLDQADSTEN